MYLFLKEAVNGKPLKQNTQNGFLNIFPGKLQDLSGTTSAECRDECKVHLKCSFFVCL